MHGVICAGVILSVMGAAFFFYVLCAPHPWPVCLVCAGTDWLVPKSPVAFHTLGLGLLPVCITPSTSASNSFTVIFIGAEIACVRSGCRRGASMPHVHREKRRGDPAHAFRHQSPLQPPPDKWATATATPTLALRRPNCDHPLHNSCSSHCHLSVGSRWAASSPRLSQHSTSPSNLGMHPHHRPG